MKNFIRCAIDHIHRKPLLVIPVVIPPLFFKDIPQGHYGIYGYVTSKEDATKRKYIETKTIKEMLQNYAHADFYWHYNRVQQSEAMPS